ncbi:FAD binding domain-containing protein [Ditylenchus destructor]|uniref:Kynurenine 3-monooxygenase n=1 Tax=Ditylenchus destructor TaxID=166010 RepID=A0AAD4NEW9_9BILA|nr:FAD binding domain-containing protein [Ditylenchus destructor]
MVKQDKPKVVIAGGGLVGALNACFFAQRGWNVEVYEARNDIRRMAHVGGRSINLALSRRGMAALEAVGLKNYIVERGVEMHARLVHDIDGKTTHRQPYGQPGEHIVSINRRHLNEALITAAERHPNICFYFRHKTIKTSQQKKEDGAKSSNYRGTVSLTVQSADMILACDGAHSAVRRSLMSRPMFQYSQTYIEHGYVELNVRPTKDDQFALESNVFHLWPRGNFTLIALANTDRTFTVTLFAPFELFRKELNTDTNLWQFFQHYFPDVTILLGKEEIISAFHHSDGSRREALPLVSIKCEPHVFESNRVLLMGDAAHAMVPFYGQGMNSGFEDCLVLTQSLETRCADLHSIVDLSMYNYNELKDLVNKTDYKLRKRFDLFLNKYFPTKWIPLYSMVTFTRIPYSQVIALRQWQDSLIRKCLWVFASSAVISATVLYTYIGKREIFHQYFSWFIKYFN